MRNVRWLDDVWRLALKAMSHGATVKRLGQVHWDLAGNCEQPWAQEFYGRPSDDWPEAIPLPKRPISVEMDLRCRRCDACLRLRRFQWRKRMATELKATEARDARTWFLTLTLDPQHRFRVISECRREWVQTGGAPGTPDWDSLPEDDQFRWIARTAGKEVTRYLKRVRHAWWQRHGRPSGVQAFRYVVVAEAHADGFPHFHVLLSEVDPSYPVTEQDVRGQRIGVARIRNGQETFVSTRIKRWTYGQVSEAKLVRDVDGACRYISKYLSKSMLARVRASIGYGKDTLSKQSATSSPQREKNSPQKYEREGNPFAPKSPSELPPGPGGGGVDQYINAKSFSGLHPREGHDASVSDECAPVDTADPAMGGTFEPSGRLEAVAVSCERSEGYHRKFRSTLGPEPSGNRESSISSGTYRCEIPSAGKGSLHSLGSV